MFLIQLQRQLPGLKKILRQFCIISHPNPFNPTTSITYEIAKTGMVTIIVYDILGREVSLLVNEIRQPGKYSVQFEASEFSSGVYFYRMNVNDYVSTRKMIFVR